MGLQVTLDVDANVGKPEINTKLTPEQKSELSNLLIEFNSVFSEKPGCTNILEHDIEVTTVDVELDEEEKSVMKLSPKFCLRERLTIEDLELELEVAHANLRRDKSSYELILHNL